MTDEVFVAKVTFPTYPPHHPTPSGASPQGEAAVSANKARGMLAYCFPVGGDSARVARWSDAPLYGVLPHIGLLDMFALTERLL